jgi:thymidine kinase
MSGGSFNLILGSMKSGKSSILLEELNRRKFAKKKCVVIRPKIDNREFLTRDPLALSRYNVLTCESLRDIWNEIFEYDVICIDEGQFIKFLGQDCNALANSGKTIIVAALAGSSEKTAWQEISMAIPYADNIKKINAVCDRCFDDSKPTFTFFTGIKEPGGIVIGDGEYRAYCRECWEIANKEKINLKVC